MPKIVHPLAGTIAFLTIAAFWLSTALSELFGSTETIAAVKTAIPWGFLILIPALMATGASGFALAGERRPKRITVKIRRTVICAANGALVLMPSALFLAAKARSADFDGVFQAVQGLELAAGATNVALLGLNMRDGLRMTGRFRRPVSRPINHAGV